MAQSDASRTRIAIVREDTAGTTPTSPAFEVQRVKAPITINRVLTGIQSEELNSDRNQSPGFIVDSTISGGWDFEFSHNSQYTLLPGVLCRDWSKTNERVGTSEVTSCDTTTFTVTSGTAFAEGDIIRTINFDNDDNNKVFVALAGSSATAVVTTGLVAETPTNVKVQVKKVGVQASSGDIVIPASGYKITSTTLDFTGLGLLAGQWIKLAGFATSADNDYCRVKSVSTNEIIFSEVPSGWTADDGTGVQVSIYIPDFIYNGTDQITYTVEEMFGAHDPVNYCYYRGEMPNSMSFTFDPEAVLGGSIDFLGQSASDITTSRPSGATTIPASNTTPYNSSVSIGSIRFDGSEVSGPSYPTSLSLEINNNLSETKVLGQIESASVNLGRFTVTGNLSTLFADATIYNKILAGTAISIDFTLVDGDSHAMVFDIPAIKFLSSTIDITDNDSPMILPADISAYGDDDLGYTLGICQFEYVA